MFSCLDRVDSVKVLMVIFEAVMLLKCLSLGVDKALPVTTVVFILLRLTFKGHCQLFIKADTHCTADWYST